MQSEKRDNRRLAWRLACTDAAAQELREANSAVRGEAPDWGNAAAIKFHAATMRAKRMLRSKHPDDLPTCLRKKVELFQVPGLPR
jgi:hypothetical protein